jgi:hypothetical protein
VRWGIQQANASGAPLYLESTVEAASLYETCGFTAGETISLPVCVGGGSETQIYEEIVFTYRPAQHFPSKDGQETLHEDYEKNSILVIRYHILLGPHLRIHALMSLLIRQEPDRPVPNPRLQTPRALQFHRTGLP